MRKSFFVQFIDCKDKTLKYRVPDLNSTEFNKKTPGFFVSIIVRFVYF